MTKRAATLLALMALLVSVPAPAANASARQDFSLNKTCPSLTYADPTVACDITGATGPLAMFNGGWIVYEDRVYWERADKIREVARVHLVTMTGDTTLRGQIRWLDDHGVFTFSMGTGDASGYHANGLIQFAEMASDGRPVFSLTGTYHYEGR